MTRLIEFIVTLEQTDVITDSENKRLTVNIEGKGSRPLIHCGECKYYDPPHVENNGVRHEYSEFPPEAFDTVLLDKSVTVEYGINVGGRCCRYCGMGYPDDKRVFVSPDNYCGMAERKKTENE